MNEVRLSTSFFPMLTEQQHEERQQIRNTSCTKTILGETRHSCSNI